MTRKNPATDDWPLCDALPPLRPGKVQIWRLEAPESKTELSACKLHLSSEELARAARLRKPESQREFLSGRAALRFLLASHLGVAAQSIVFAIGPNGKPTLPTGPSFNVAHSGGTVLLALAPTGHLGIDIETVNRATRFLEVAERSFTAAERDEVTSLADPTSQRQGFYRLWTRKEAIAKADGRGIGIGLERLAVSPLTEAKTPVRVPPTATSPEKLFYVSNLPVEDDFAAAFATDLPHQEITCQTFPLWFLAS